MSIATRDHFGEALFKLGARDPRVVVLNCDLGTATRTLKFKREFPNRFIECGISEANAISVASGLAKAGFIPFVCSFGHFLTGKFLEIFQSVGLNDSSVVLVGTHAGLAIGKDGPTQMGLRDLALMRLLPNVKIYHPCDGAETYAALDAIVKVPGPSYLRLCRQPGPELHASIEINFGAPDILKTGSRLLVISQGGPLPEIVAAAKDLGSVGIANASTLPLQVELWAKLISNYQALLIVEDHFEKGGLADEFARLVLENGLKVTFKCIGVKGYAQSGDPGDLYKRYGLDQEAIRGTLQSLL